MSKLEINDIAGMIHSEINAWVDDLFIDAQEILNIENGDISPIDAYELEQKANELAEIIIRVLEFQKG